MTNPKDRIIQAAIAFVAAVDTDAQIDAVFKQAPDEWIELADAVIMGRSAVESSPKRSVETVMCPHGHNRLMMEAHGLHCDECASEKSSPNVPWECKACDREWMSAGGGECPLCERPLTRKLTSV